MSLNNVQRQFEILKAEESIRLLAEEIAELKVVSKSYEDAEQSLTGAAQALDAAAIEVFTARNALDDYLKVHRQQVDGLRHEVEDRVQSSAQRLDKSIEVFEHEAKRIDDAISRLAMTREAVVSSMQTQQSKIDRLEPLVSEVLELIGKTREQVERQAREARGQHITQEEQIGVLHHNLEKSIDSGRKEFGEKIEVVNRDISRMSKHLSQVRAGVIFTGLLLILLIALATSILIYGVSA